MVFRDVMDDEQFSFVIGWAETHDVPHETRVAGGRLQVGMSRYHWRKAEYLGVA